MTDKVIIKALECCIKSEHMGDCFENKCPMISDDGCTVAEETLCPYALDLINRQQAEIERLKEIANPKCQQCAERTRKNSFVEFAEEFEKRCIASGIYPAFVKCAINDVVKELTEGNK